MGRISISSGNVSICVLHNIVEPSAYIDRYLWEKQQPELAKSFFCFGLSLGVEQHTTMVAQAYRLLGHNFLDMARPSAALDAYQQALSIRQKLEGANSPRIAEIYDSIACSYTEIGKTELAMEYLAKATAIHNINDPKKMSRTEAIRAMAFLRAGKPNEALDALHKCWELQNLSEEQVAISKYPKHSGDIVLLARINSALGNASAGQQLAARALSIRRQIFGQNGGPRVADSLFILSRMLEEKHEHVLSAKLLREIIDMSHGVPEMKGHLARALWFLAQSEEKLDDKGDNWTEIREKAKKVRREIDSKEGADVDSNDGYIALVSWILW